LTRTTLLRDFSPLINETLRRGTSQMCAMKRISDSFA
jgi:hypothetical protein